MRVSSSDEGFPAGAATTLNPPLIRGEEDLAASGWDLPLAAIGGKGTTRHQQLKSVFVVRKAARSLTVAVLIEPPAQRRCTLTPALGPSLLGRLV